MERDAFSRDIITVAERIAQLFSVRRSTSISLAEGQSVVLYPRANGSTHVTVVDYERLAGGDDDRWQFLLTESGGSVKAIHRPIESLDSVEASRRRFSALMAATNMLTL